MLQNGHKVSLEPEEATEAHRERLSEHPELLLDDSNEYLESEACSFGELYHQLSGEKGEVFDVRLENPEVHSVDNLAEFMDNFAKKEDFDSALDSVNTYAISDLDSNAAGAYTVIELMEISGEVKHPWPFANSEVDVPTIRGGAYVSQTSEGHWEIGISDAPEYFI